MTGFNGSQAPTQDAGLDVEGQIREGVTAFMQSQDPAIAVEVVNMLAGMMGIAPEINPYGQQDPALSQGQVPAASNGMRFYRKGGKIQKHALGGKTTDPENKKKEAEKQAKDLSSQLSVDYIPMNPKSTPQQNEYKIKENFARAQRLKSMMGPGGNAVKSNYDEKSGSQISRYISPMENMKADSVITATQAHNQAKFGMKKKRGT